MADHSWAPIQAGIDKRLAQLLKPTKADRFRSMTDEELATFILENGNDEQLHFCRNKPECGEMLDPDGDIPREMCKQCVLDWLRQPAKEAADE